MSSKKNSTTIKKYANRRLYNTATSSYVTLEDLSEMVKNNEDFNVYDAKSSEDITRSVLTQIIMEEENKSGQQNLLPTNFLRQLIGFYGNNLQWMVPKYLEQSMEMLTGNQDQINEYFKTSLGSMFPFGTTFEEMSKQNMSMFENTMKMLSPFGQGLNLELPNPLAMASNVAANASSSSSQEQSSSSNSKNSSQKQQPKASACDLSQQQKPQPKAQPSSESKPAPKAESKKEAKKEDSNVASITNLKPKKESKKKAEKKSEPKAEAKKQDTPMPNVANASSNKSGSDDMQQKIANLQRQLADLAKSRA